MSKYTSIAYDRRSPQVRMQRVLNSPPAPLPPVPPPITWLISGIVADNGTGFSAPLEVTGIGTITSAASGSYGFLVVDGYSGTVIPHSASGTFDPESRSYTSVGTNYPGQDYAFYAYPPLTISGAVTLDTILLDGAVVDISGVGTVTTSPHDLALIYVGTVPYGYSGAITLPEYSPWPMFFDSVPPVRVYTNLTTSQVNQDFDITRLYHEITGTTYQGDAVTPLSIQLDNGTTVITTAADGSYGYFVQGGWSGSTVPVQYITDPLQLDYDTVQIPYVGQDLVVLAPALQVFDTVLDYSGGLADPNRWFIYGTNPWDGTASVIGTNAGSIYALDVAPYGGTEYTVIGVNAASEPVTMFSNPVTTSAFYVWGTYASNDVPGGAGSLPFSVTDGTFTIQASNTDGYWEVGLFPALGGYSGTITPINWITDPPRYVYSSVNTDQEYQNFQLYSPTVFVAGTYFSWSGWPYELPDRWIIYSKNPVDATYTAYATNAGTTTFISIGDTGSYYRITGVTADTNQATLDSPDAYAAPPLPPIILFSGSVYNGTDSASGISANLYVDGVGTISTDSFGNWSQGVTSPYTGYVAVADPGFDGTFNPAYRAYVAETAAQSNQDFVFWPTAPTPTDCQIPSALQTITDLPTPNDVSRSVNDPDNNLLWYLDDSYDYVYYVDAVAGTFQGSITMPTGFGQSAIVYDPTNDKVVVMDWSGSIHVIDTVAKTSTRVPGINMPDPGYHMLAVNDVGTVYATDDRNVSFGSVYAIDVASASLIRSTKLTVATDSICWASNINKLVINSGGAGQPAFYIFDPVTDTFAASTLLNPAVSFRYENFYIPQTGHMLESFSGGSPSAVIDISQGTDATIVATVEPTRISNADIDTCADRLFITNGNYALWEYTLDGSYTKINEFNNNGDGISPASCSHNRQSNLIYVANYDNGTIYTYMATTQNGSVGGMVWAIDQGVNPDTTGGYMAMEGGLGWFSGSAVGEDSTPFQQYDPDMSSGFSNLGAAYPAQFTTVYTGSINDSGTLDAPSYWSLYQSFNSDFSTLSYTGTVVGTNTSFSGTLVTDGTVVAGYNTSELSVQIYCGGNFSSFPANTYVAITGSMYITPLTPP